ncbi:B-cell lymphoma 3 protein homolog [Plakobranchus ocellatus]|uniref:B-cell lymphoma 3 protein homolog n=1 Tax=Plakobranchus ocellatus TaxID=259542 RepID=A0AAV4A6I3_9GAST|nr:B-cell lymphoma 3 protein homolog [Plakobranchus ocellatus]
MIAKLPATAACGQAMKHKPISPAHVLPGLTPLHTAVDNGDLEQVDLLLSYGADIDVTDGKSGRTPLFRAAESNHKPMVELLLKRGANVDVQSYAGVTVSMAAQGRNLHGVLKLLGSIQDKFGLALDTNSNSSSNKTPQHTPSPLLYVGFPSSSKASATSTGPDGTLGQYMVKATSSSSLTSSSSSSFAPSQQLQQRQEASQRLTGVTYLIRPQSKMERADKTSGGIMLERADSRETMFEETKVFHNVFMFPDEETKKRIHHDSRSEPSSPDTCTSVDKLIGSQRKEKGKVALLSLPDNLDIGGETIKRSFTSLPSSSLQQNVVESKSSRAATVIRKVTVGSPKPPGSPQRESVAGNFVGRISSDGVLHLVPSVTVTSISSSPSAPFSCSSSPMPLIAFHPSKSRVAASCLAPSIVLPILSSAVSSPLLPASPSVLSSLSPKAGPTLQQENDSTAASQATSSLTSVQAKLYETLLRRTQSIPGSPGVVLPAQPSSPEARLMSQVLLSPLQSSSGSSSTLGNVSYRVIPNSSSNPPLVESLAVRRDAPTMVPLLMTPSFTHALKSGSSSLRSSPPNTPLNLSKPSLSRQFQDSTDKSETAANSDFDKASTDQTQIGTIQAGTGVMMSENRSSKEQGGPSETQARKIISVGMRKITNGEKSVSSVLPVASTGASFQTQYEMFLLPEKQQSDQARGASPVSGNSVVDSSNDNTRSQLQQQQMSLMSAQTVPLVCTMNPRKHSKSVADILTSVDVSTLPKMGSSNNSNLSTVSGPSIVLDPTALATMSKGDLIVPSFPHISKCVSPATAFIVRDLLSRQNQLLHKPTSSASESMSSASPISSASSLGLVTSIPASPIAHQAAGRIIIPPQGAQNNIVGLSGAILSVIPGSAMSGILSASTTQESKQSHHLQDHQKPASSSSQKEHHPRKSRASKGSSKGQKVDRPNSDADISSPSVSASSSGYPIPKLSKINSETDQKLKKFLVAKRQEVLMSNWQGDDSSSQRLEAEEESLEALEDGSSLNTVGIFSGNVQRIRLGKVKVPLSSSAQADVNSCPLVPSTMPQTASSPSVQDVLSSTPSTPSDSLPPLVIVTSSGLQTDGETRSSSPPSATPMISDPSVYSRVSSTSVIGHKNSAAEVSCETCHWNSETRVSSETGHRHRVVPQMEEDKEEPMEVDLPNSAVSSAPTSNGTMTPNSVSTSTSSGAPPNVVSADSISLKSNVQIVIQSPTPPPPVSDPSGRS